MQKSKMMRKYLAMILQLTLCLEIEMLAVAGAEGQGLNKCCPRGEAIDLGTLNCFDPGSFSSNGVLSRPVALRRGGSPAPEVSHRAGEPSSFSPTSCEVAASILEEDDGDGAGGFEVSGSVLTDLTNNQVKGGEKKWVKSGNRLK